jgi:DNA-binding transcriptional ArsR family regulator
MGDRFVLLRMRTDALANGERAIANTGRESVMRDELAAAAKMVLDEVNTAPSEITPLEIQALLYAANLTTWARTAVIRDKAGNVVDVHDREAPTRFAKQLFQILRGGVAIGLPRNEAMALAIRCAQDSIPPLRLQLLRDLASHPMSYVADVRKRLQLVHNTVDRELKALQMLRLVELDENGNHWRYRLSKEVDVAVVETFPEMYVDQQSAPDPSRGRGGTYVSGNATSSVECTADLNKQTEHQNSTLAVPDLTCAPKAHVPDFEISEDPSILEPFGPEPSDSEYGEELLRSGSGALGEPYDSAPAGLFDGCVDDDHARLPVVSLANHPAAPSLVAAKR